jgi:type IX secretion system PorP/SprF family membrane protein
MYHYAPFFTNPGQIGTVEDVRLMLNYRNQAIDVGENFQTSSLSGFYPVYIGNHRLVVAGNFINDQASDFVKTNGGLLGVAYSVSTTANSELSFGAQGGYFQKKVSSNFSTDDQFVNGVFDSNEISSDAILNRSKGYPTLSAGLYYRIKDTEGREKVFVGGSIFNILEPNISFIDSGDDKLPSSIKATVGYRAYQGLKLSVMPTMRIVSQTDNSFLNLGSRFGYQLESTEEGIKKIDLGLWYNTNNLGVFSVAYEQPNLILGVNYNLPVNSDLSAGQNGIFELAISLKLKKAKKKERKVVPLFVVTERPETEIETTQEEKITQQNEPEEISDIEEVIVEEKQSVPVKVIENESAEQPVLTESDRTILAKTVRFKLNSNELNQESKVFLDEVTALMKRNEWLKADLVGHTCDLGPEKLNEELSLNRAKKVREYLLEKGVDTSRFIIKGSGETNPIDITDTEEGRTINRRVEFKIIE